MTNGLVLITPSGSTLFTYGTIPSEMESEIKRAAHDLSSDFLEQTHRYPQHLLELKSNHSRIEVKIVEVLPIKRADCDIAQVLERVIKPLRAQAETLDVGLSLNIAPNVPKHLALDSKKIGWIVTSLVGNSLRYVRHGTRNLPGGAINLDVSYQPEQSRLTLAVRDDGPGISSDRIPWLFSPKTEGEATSGLALKLVHDILAAQGGTIRVESATEGDKCGTSFFIEVPAPTLLKPQFSLSGV